MDTSARSIGGGLLAGLGKGLQARSEREHEDMMLAKKEALEDARQLRQQQFLSADRTADRNERFGERTADISERAAERLATTQERQGERADHIADQTAGRTARSNENKLDRESREKIAKERGASAGSDGELAGDEQRSVARDRAWNRAVKRFTALAPGKVAPFDQPETDWKAVGQAMQDQGYPDLARQAIGKYGGEDGGDNTDTAPPADDTAAPAPQARAPASSGNGVDARWDPETRRFTTAPAAASAPGGSMFTGRSIQGGGTKQNPYQGTDQASLDWFKKNAQPGDVISVSGKLYTK